MVSNQEDLTAPIEDISPKQRYSFYGLKTRKNHLQQLGNSPQCESSSQERPGKFVKSEMNVFG